MPLSLMSFLPSLTLLFSPSPGSPSGSSGSSGSSGTSLPPQLVSELLAVKPTQVLVNTDEYNPRKGYIPRAHRKEWACVGLLGQIRVRDDGTCIVGKKCGCLNGIATQGNIWRVLERIDTDVIRILFFTR